MFLSDRTMKLLMELDAPVDQKVELLNSMREDERVAAPSRSKGAERQARYEARKRQKASESVTADHERNNHDQSFSLPPSPQTPQPPTHIRECVSTREREATEFDRFWAVYPKRVGKDDARKAFARALKRSTTDEMIQAVERQRDWEQWQRGFIPNPSTWLNQGRWADEQPPTAQPTNQRHPHERPDQDRQPPRSDRLRSMYAGAMAAVDDPFDGF